MSTQRWGTEGGLGAPPSALCSRFTPLALASDQMPVPSLGTSLSSLSVLNPCIQDDFE